MNDVDVIFNDKRHFKSRIKRLSKKHEDEVSQTLTNFSKVTREFKNSNVEQLRRSKLVRPESNGVLAVDQDGCRTRSPHQIRLYIYPWEDESGKHIMVLTAGDKNRQQEDNNYCAKCLKKADLK